MEKAIEIYESMARPPASVLKTIKGGKLAGKSDINPQWRYKIMTEKFGLCGIGWKYDILKLWTEQGAGNEVLAFAQIAVYIKDGDKWSEPIIGIGGSKLVQSFKTGLESNDEGFKMAVTDAFSTSLKMLGVAADIYAGKWDGSKYADQAEDTIPTQPTQYSQTEMSNSNNPYSYENMKKSLENFLANGVIQEANRATTEKYINDKNLKGMKAVLDYCNQSA